MPHLSGKYAIKRASYLRLKMISGAFLLIAMSAPATHAQANSCAAAAAELNKRFVTVKSQQAGGDIPEDSGILVHTIHGPGDTSKPAKPGYLDFGKLEHLDVNAATTCGAHLKAGDYLPWCGSNTKPNTSVLSDASSWTFVRADTAIQGAAPGDDDEVVCSDDFDKRYGLIFSNGYMNQQVNGVDNLGCMYPMDGDTGFRDGQGCGISVRSFANQGQAEAQCPLTETSSDYESYFETLVETRGSVAGSLTCSLAKPQFNTWVDVRKRVDLSKTSWPVNEFVLWNWDTYSTKEIAAGGYLVGIYYLSGCQRTPQNGKKDNAQRIAKLYKDWSGVDVPVVQLSNAAIRDRTDQPFSCP